MIRIGAIGAVLSGALHCVDASAATLAWRIDAGTGQGEVRVEGLPAPALATIAARGVAAGDGEQVLRVVVAPHGIGGDTLPAAWGAWSVDGGALVFRPRHAPAPGTTLSARFDGKAFASLAGSGGIADATLRVDFPAVDRTARVVEATPGGATVPQNLLRFYVHFSRSMSLRGAGEHVRLRRADGTIVEQAFASPADGLWDPARRRLTLIVHPGRVKSGLELGEALGPVLVAGEDITLEVDAGLRDADGAPLREAYSRTWRVAAAEHDALDLSRWELRAPASPMHPLRVLVPQGLDAEVVPRALALVGPGGEDIDGTWSIQPGELAFAPARPWRTGQRYALVAAAFLEDVSGNRPGRPFERVQELAPAGAARRRLDFVVD